MAQESTSGRDAVDHFQSIPWCRAHINDPNFQVLNSDRVHSAARGPTSGSLFGETWYTETTIPYLLVLYRPPPTTHGRYGEMRRLFTLGTGLNEHANTLHGGAIAAVLDNAMGKLARYEQFSTYTVTLNVSYKKAVTTPSTIMTRSWITKVEGRKIWAYAQIESGSGKIHATAEGLLLRPVAALL